MEKHILMLKSKSNLWCGRLIYILLAFTILSSCKDDSTLPDTVPIIEISPAQEDLLIGLVTVAVKVTDQNKFRKATLFVDGNSVKEFLIASFNYEWDTRLLTDGRHELKVVAENENGNTGELITVFETFNTLFKFSPPQNLDEAVEQWVYASDKDGIPSLPYKFKKNEEIKIATPVTHTRGDRYVLTFFQRNESTDAFGTDVFYVQNSYVEIEPGDYQYKNGTFNASATQPPHTLKIFNAPNPYDVVDGFGRNVTGVNSSFTIGNPITCTGYFTGTSTSIKYYILAGAEHKYLKMENVLPGGMDEVDYTDFVTFENSLTFTFDEPVKARCYVYAADDKDYAHSIRLPHSKNIGLVPATSFEYYYSDDEFDEFITYVSSNTDEKSDVWMSVGNAINNQHKTWKGNVTSIQRQGLKFTTTLSESASILQIQTYWDLDTSSGSDNFVWNVYVPGKTTYEASLPSFPEALAKLYPKWNGQIIDFRGARTVTMAGSTGYEDFIKFNFKEGGQLIFGEFLFAPYKEVIIHEQIATLTSGRQGRSKKIMDGRFLID